MGRRGGPAAPARPELPDEWPRRLAVTVVSADRGVYDRIVQAMSRDRAHDYTAPAVVVRQVGACADLPSEWSSAPPDGRRTGWECLVVDAASDDASNARFARWPALYVAVDARPAAAVGAEHAALAHAAFGPAAIAHTIAGASDPRRPQYTLDPILAWDDTLRAVPFRTCLDDPTFAARLRSRVALLPADVRSERLFAAVTASADDVPLHALETLECAECRGPASPADAVVEPLRRDLDGGEALLRLLLRPEWYVGGASHSVRPAAHGAAHGASRGTSRGAHRRWLERACARCGLVPPTDALHVALILRASALAEAYGLAIDVVKRMLGFAPADATGPRSPATSTMHRVATKMTGAAPGELLRLRWPDLDEAARRALVRPREGSREVDGPGGPVFAPVHAEGIDALTEVDDVDAYRPLRVDSPPDGEGWGGAGPVLGPERDPPPRAGEPDPHDVLARAQQFLDASASASDPASPASAHAAFFLEALAAAGIPAGAGPAPAATSPPVPDRVDLDPAAFCDRCGARKPPPDAAPSDAPDEARPRHRRRA